MERWDGYRKDGSPAGVELVRGEPIPDGIYHMVSEILVRHIDGDYLLMQRDPRKTHFGGYFEATAGGAALMGEDIHACAMRELTEETGITAVTLEEIGHCYSRDTIYRLFLGITDCDKTAVSIQDGETVAYRWVEERTFAAFVRSDEMIPTQKARYADFFAKMGYLY